MSAIDENHKSRMTRIVARIAYWFNLSTRRGSISHKPPANQMPPRDNESTVDCTFVL